MGPRRIKVQFSPTRHRWEASSRIPGAVYTVLGRNPEEAFKSLCRMLGVQTARWRIIEAGENIYSCQELDKGLLPLAEGSTVVPLKSE